MAEQNPYTAPTAKVLISGLAELNELCKALETSLKAPESETRTKEACKAFEELFLKSGAMESAFTAAKSIDSSSFYKPLAWAQYYRHALSVLGGCLRESQQVVVGKAFFADPARLQEALELIRVCKSQSQSIAEELAKLSAQ